MIHRKANLTLTALDAVGASSLHSGVTGDVPVSFGDARMSMSKLILILPVILLLQGCLGVGWWGKGSTTITNPSHISDVARLDGLMRGRQALDYYYTAPWLQSHWGTPKSVHPGSVASEELWTYEFKQCWCGLIPMVVIPIPLLLPVGHEKVIFLIRDGRVIGAERVESHRGGVGGGLLGPDGPWCTLDR